MYLYVPLMAMDAGHQKSSGKLGRQRETDRDGTAPEEPREHSSS